MGHKFQIRFNHGLCGDAAVIKFLTNKILVPLLKKYAGKPSESDCSESRSVILRAAPITIESSSINIEFRFSQSSASVGGGLVHARKIYVFQNELHIKLFGTAVGGHHILS